MLHPDPSALIVEMLFRTVATASIVPVPRLNPSAWLHSGSAVHRSLLSTILSINFPVTGRRDIGLKVPFFLGLEIGTIRAVFHALIEEMSEAKGGGGVLYHGV